MCYQRVLFASISSSSRQRGAVAPETALAAISPTSARACSLVNFLMSSLTLSNVMSSQYGTKHETKT
jgi:hypothetical protein